MFRFYLSYFYYYWGAMHRYFGISNGVKREIKLAAHFFKRSYETDPSFLRARVDRAIMLGRELGLLEEAFKELDYVLREDPRHADARLNRGLLRQENGNFAGALTDLEAYLRLPETEYHDQASRTVVYLRELLREANS